MCSPFPRSCLREQKTQSNGHFEVSSIQMVLGQGAINSLISCRDSPSDANADTWVQVVT
jgi:hypothetical protein